MKRETCPECGAEMMRHYKSGGRAGVVYTCPRSYTNRKPASKVNCPVSFIRLFYDHSTHAPSHRRIIYDSTYKTPTSAGDNYLEGK